LVSVFQSTAQEAYFLVCLLIYLLKLKVRSARAAGLLVAKIVPKDFIFIFLFFLYFLFCLYLFVCLKFKPFKRILSEILPKESQKSCKAKMFIDVMFCYSLTLLKLNLIPREFSAFNPALC